MGAVEDRIALTAAGGEAAHPGATEKILAYWRTGKGAAKIRWNEPCAFCRCLTHLGKFIHNPEELKGTCANLEKSATGHWPNAEHSRTHHCPC